VLRAEHRLSPLSLAPHLGAFLDGAATDMQARLAPQAQWDSLTSAQAVLDWIDRENLQQVILPYAPVGPVAETAAEAEQRSDVPFLRIRRAYDTAAWPHATHGFFRFKEKIPALVAQMNGIGLAA
jgi:deoxyribodipyrimidine photo-lyase